MSVAQDRPVELAAFHVLQGFENAVHVRDFDAHLYHLLTIIGFEWNSSGKARVILRS
jgi:hypothetical protein